MCIRDSLDAGVEGVAIDMRDGQAEQVGMRDDTARAAGGASREAGLSMGEAVTAERGHGGARKNAAPYARSSGRGRRLARGSAPLPTSRRHGSRALLMARWKEAGGVLPLRTTSPGHSVAWTAGTWCWAQRACFPPPRRPLCARECFGSHPDRGVRCQVTVSKGPVAFGGVGFGAVSYTHLTLPTKRIV